MIAIVTGASRGIGRQAAIALAAYPDSKVYALARNEERLAELASVHDNITPITCDLQKKDGIFTAVQQIEEEGVDILINNAGMLINKPFEHLESAEFEAVYKVNVLAPAILIQALLNKLRNAEGISHVINVSSMGGFQGSAKFPGLSAYSSSKAAIASLTECLAEEYKESNTRFNCLCFGAVQTEMLEEAFPGYQAPVSAEQMGKYVASFAVDGAIVFNGKVLPVALSNP